MVETTLLRTISLPQILKLVRSSFLSVDMFFIAVVSMKICGVVAGPYHMVPVTMDRAKNGVLLSFP